MSKVFAKYTKHNGFSPAGHIFLDKEGACTIHLEGAAAMSQEELNHYAEIMTEALNKSVSGLKKGDWPYPSYDYTGG
jgi:hypothetical protein